MPNSRNILTAVSMLYALMKYRLAPSSFLISTISKSVSGIEKNLATSDFINSGARANFTVTGGVAFSNDSTGGEDYLLSTGKIEPIIDVSLSCILLAGLPS